MDEDPDRDLLGRLLLAWRAEFYDTSKMIRDAVNKADNNQNSELYEILNDIAGDRNGINRRILGHWIKRHAHQIVDGFKFISGNEKRSAAMWRVIKTDNK